MCRRMIAVLPHTGVSIFHQDADLRYQWAQNVPAAWSKILVEGLSDRDILPGGAAERLTLAKQDVMRLGEAQSLEIQFDAERRMMWYDVRIEPVRDENGKIAGITTIVVETTDQKRREQTLSTLLREVSHRSKNLLAIILSIASQTGRYSTNVDLFLARFRGRIQSLASSQDLVTSSNWRGAGLRDLVRHQTARYCATPDGNVRFEGVDVHLNPNAALHVGLGLHELAVNSVSYGALTRPEGVVTIVSALAADGVLSLRWSESLPANAARGSAGERRFGSVALERVVPSAVGGTANLTLGAERLDYVLTIPPDQFELT